jgi:hypothetical protein
MLTGGCTGNCRLPSLEQEIQEAGAEGNGPKTQDKNGKGRKELTNGVDLDSGKDYQEQPHPFPTAIFLAHLLLNSLFPRIGDRIERPAGKPERTVFSPDRKAQLFDLPY